jgi:hypothetical protein
MKKGAFSDFLLFSLGKIDDRDGMEFSIGGSGYRPTINSYMYDRRWMLWYKGYDGIREQIGLALHEGEDLGFK